MWQCYVSTRVLDNAYYLISEDVFCKNLSKEGILKPIKSILLFVTIQVTSLPNPHPTCFHSKNAKSEQVSRDDQRSGNPYKGESSWAFLYLMLV